MSENDLTYRLRKRAEIRRNINTRKSVKEGKPDRIADLLDEAADAIDVLVDEERKGDNRYLMAHQQATNFAVQSALVKYLISKVKELENAGRP